MRDCEACGLSLSESVDRCPQCAQPVTAAVAPGHLSRVAIAGHPGATHYGTLTAIRGTGAPDFTPPNQFSSASPGAPVRPPTARQHQPAQDPDESDDLDDGYFAADRVPPRSPATPSSSDWDPDATTRFMPAYASRNDIKNTAALVALAVALVAAVSSLAWLIGQSVSAGRPLARPSVSAPSATPISTAIPKNATVCTPEVARSTNTSCTLARRVLSSVRTLGTDLPDTFRVTVTDPQTAKNATFVCSIKSWIQCVGGGDVTVYVMRQV